MVFVMSFALSSFAHADVEAQSSRQPLTVTLADVLRATEAENPLVQAARLRVEAARGARMSAGTIANPVLTYQVENTGFPGRSTPAGFTRETSSFATLPLEPIWQRPSRIRKADENTRVAEADLAAVRRLVLSDAAKAFFRTALAQVAVNGAADIQDGLDSLLRYSRVRVQEGATSEGDLIRLQVERDRAATERVLQQAELVRARAALLPYLNDSAQLPSRPTITVVVDDGVAEAGSTLAPITMFASRAAARPDVLAARARASVADAETTLQRALLVRQLGATLGTKSTGGAYSMIAGFSVPLPLFDQNRGEVQRATSERTAAEKELAWAERRAAADISAAYDVAQLLTTDLTALDRTFLDRAAEARRIAVTAYQEGATSLLQVIDATRTLADARLIYYRALFARQDSLLDLYAAAALESRDAIHMTPPPALPPGGEVTRATHSLTGRN